MRGAATLSPCGPFCCNPCHQGARRTAEDRVDHFLGQELEGEVEGEEDEGADHRELHGILQGEEKEEESVVGAARLPVASPQRVGQHRLARCHKGKLQMRWGQLEGLRQEARAGCAASASCPRPQQHSRLAFLDIASAGGSGFTDRQLPTYTCRQASSKCRELQAVDVYGREDPGRDGWLPRAPRTVSTAVSTMLKFVGTLVTSGSTKSRPKAACARGTGSPVEGSAVASGMRRQRREQVSGPQIEVMKAAAAKRGAGQAPAMHR